MANELSLEEKALRFDLDQAGIRTRNADAIELVELRSKVARQQRRLARYENVIKKLIKFMVSHDENGMRVYNEWEQQQESEPELQPESPRASVGHTCKGRHCRRNG